jgi:amino acid permease
MKNKPKWSDIIQRAINTCKNRNIYALIFILVIFLLSCCSAELFISFLCCCLNLILCILLDRWFRYSDLGEKRKALKVFEYFQIAVLVMYAISIICLARHAQYYKPRSTVMPGPATVFEGTEND